MKIVIKISLLFVFLATSGLFAQDEEVSEYLKLIAQGKVKENAAEINKLINEYPDEPSTRLLAGVIDEDAFKAIEHYKWIIQNHPDSEWADDAYWRFIQFYAVLGDTAKAHYELNNFRKRFPYSDLLIPATDVVYAAIRIARKDAPHTITTPTTTETTGTSASTNTSETGGAKAYGLQIGLYGSRANAEAQQKKFLEMRMRTEILPKNIDGRQMFAVVIGHYKTKKSAQNAMIVVSQKCGCDPIIYEKQP